MPVSGILSIMAQQPPLYSPDRPGRVETSLEPYALARPHQAEWQQILPGHRLPVIVKSLLIVALGVYLSGGPLETQAVETTMALTAVLWAVLYALNESTDLIFEHRLLVPKYLPAGLLALAILLCLSAAFLSPALSLLLGLMIAGQVAYCLPPMRLKRHWWAVFVLSGTLNPILRLECGAVWGKHPIPFLAYLVFISLHLGASSRTRVLLRERDQKLGYQIAPAWLEGVGKLCTGLGLTGGVLLCMQEVLPRFLLFSFPLVAAFVLYAWSERAVSVARLRIGWIWFAILALLILVGLYTMR